ncbi:MAG: hypothetical protein Q4G07_00885 [Oscillospiraceae bacterium]|nr:hypothetical protein [Oscillospiraceae bacterium]
MASPYFKAILKTQAGQLLEYGYGRADPQQKSVDFFGEFVPLMKMGDKARVVRVADGQETHCFDGEVYLSSKGLLRLVGVQNAEETENPPMLTVNETMAAEATPLDGSAGAVASLLYAVSLDTVKFSCLGSFAVGSTVTLQSDGPLRLTGVMARIERQIALSAGVTCHLCTVLSMPEESRRSLTSYAETQGRL